MTAPKKRTSQFAQGDLVYHVRADADNLSDRDWGNVTGFAASGPNGQWVTVRSRDGKNRIWLKSNVVNLSLDLKG